MKEKLLKGVFITIALLAAILLFAGIDYFIHNLKLSWSVPEYYYRNKISAGFLWGIAGLLLAKKFQSIWLRAAVFSGVVAAPLQVRYFLERYALDFVLIFLLIHFAILYFLSAGMFWVFKKYIKTLFSRS